MESRPGPQRDCDRARSWYDLAVSVSLPPPLRTSIGDITLHEYRLTLAGRTWSFLHTGAVVTLEDEQRYLAGKRDRMPYGAMLWPASIALAHDVVERAAGLAGKRVLELGAGTGVPGIVAASLGARVLQTDRNEVALHVCAMNAARNGVTDIDVQHAEWERLTSDHPFDVILGSDLLYATNMHATLRAICEAHLAPGGTVLFSDPLRAQSLPVLEAMDADGWRVGLAKWSIAVETGTRTIAVYELSRR
jgi:predicted nicotinamide N-methyase